MIRIILLVLFQTTVIERSFAEIGLKQFNDSSDKPDAEEEKISNVNSCQEGCLQKVSQEKEVHLFWDRRVQKQNNK